MAHSLTLLSSFLILGGAAFLLPSGDLERGSHVGPFLAGASILCAGFLMALRIRTLPAATFWGVAAGARLLLLVMEPGSDIYRYLWEGEIQNLGFSPYCSAPSAVELAPYRDQLWHLLKHRDVTAIYPPLAELVFRGITAVSTTVLAMKLVFTAADLATCWLLATSIGPAAAIGYAWNPLVLYSFSGGGHYDSLFVLALTAGCLLWERGEAPRWRLGAVGCLGAGMALKWLCAPILCWCLWRMLIRNRAAWFALAVGAAVLPLATSWMVVSAGHGNCPLVPADFARVARSAEALPALADWLLPPQHVLRRNSSYLYVFLAAAVVLLWRQASIQRAAHSVLSAALLTTPMFHAWYATWLMPLEVKDRNRGSVAISVSAFAYFWLHHTVAREDGIWRQSAVEKLLLWGPFVIGLAWDSWIRRRAPRGDPPASSSPAS